MNYDDTKSISNFRASRRPEKYRRRGKGEWRAEAPRPENLLNNYIKAGMPMRAGWIDHVYASPQGKGWVCVFGGSSAQTMNISEYHDMMSLNSLGGSETARYDECRSLQFMVFEFQDPTKAEKFKLDVDAMMKPTVDDAPERLEKRTKELRAYQTWLADRANVTVCENINFYRYFTLEDRFLDFGVSWDLGDGTELRGVTDP